MGFNRSLVVRRSGLFVGAIGIWLVSAPLFWIAGEVFYGRFAGIGMLTYPFSAMLFLVASWYRSEHRSGILLLIASVASLAKFFILTSSPLF